MSNCASHEDHDQHIEGGLFSQMSVKVKMPLIEVFLGNLGAYAL